MVDKELLIRNMYRIRENNYTNEDLSAKIEELMGAMVARKMEEMTDDVTRITEKAMFIQEKMLKNVAEIRKGLSEIATPGNVEDNLMELNNDICKLIMYLMI